MKNLLLVIVILVAGFEYFNHRQSSALSAEQFPASELIADNSDALIANAFSNHQSNLQISGQGTVIRLLPDDRSGSKHQKFIIKLASDQTLLVAHNIDLAPKVPSLRAGDLIQFNGEYEWNEKGGILHWTHRDPNGRHAAGWLKHQGKTYQ